MPSAKAFDSHSSYVPTDGATAFFFAAEAGMLTAIARTAVITSVQIRMILLPS
jgi:hypothetical protein